MNAKKYKPRTDDNSRFAREYTDEDFMLALVECQANATCTAAEVAERMGCSARYAKDRLSMLASEQKVEKVLRGNAWGFKPVDR